MHLLHFHECNIKAIKAKAFDSQTFRNVQEIEFSNNKDYLRIENDAFAGMPNLTSFTLSCILFDTIDPNIIWGFEKSIEKLNYRGFKQPIPFQDLFGGGPFDKLYEVNINNNFELYMLTQANFTGLSQIANLHIVHTGISLIYTGTFHVISKTLRFLHICSSRMRSPQFVRFSPFLLSALQPNALIPRKYNQPKTFIFQLNPVQCNCEFYFLKYITLTSIGLHRGFNSVKCMLRQDPDVDATGLRTCGMHSISTKKLCLKSSELSFVAHFKFQIRFYGNDSANYVEVKFDALYTYTTFHLLIIGSEQESIEHQHCHDREWLQKNAKCFIMTFRYTRSWVPLEIDRTRFNFIAVSFFTPTRIWPLRLVTVRPVEMPVDVVVVHSKQYLWDVIVISLVASVAGFLLGIFWIVRNKRN